MPLEIFGILQNFSDFFSKEGRVKKRHEDS